MRLLCQETRKCLEAVLFLLLASSISARASDMTLSEFLSVRLAQAPITIGSKEKKSLSPEDICSISTDSYARRIFAEYGAMFAADSTVSIPWKCIFDRSEEVAAFQNSLKTRSVLIDGVAIDLQESAMNALAKSADEAAARKLRIIPFDGAIAGRRSYNDTIALWASRFFPALDYWVRVGNISESDAVAGRSLPIRRQVEKVMEWEDRGFYFGTSRAGSIFSSTAPPGTSQHLSLLAFDVKNYWDSNVREILASNGWFQTVAGDPTHFTYLGVKESDLTSRGLVRTDRGTFRYWVPRL